MSVLVATSCFVQELEYAGNPDGPRVVFVGDSLTFASVDRIHTDLDPDHQVMIRAAVGHTFEMMQPEAEAAAATDPDIVLINLGTNDVSDLPAYGPLQHVLDQLDAMVALFPASCVVLTTVRTDVDPAADPDYDNAAAAELNDALVGHADRVVDWAAVPRSAGNPLLADAVHLAPDGMAIMTALQRAEIDACTAAL